jgi:hypothetical protein
LELNIEDESHLHAGHAGAATGGGHFKLTIVAPEFDPGDQSDVITSARKIMEKELMRVDEFARDAVNSAEVSGKDLGRMLIMGEAK